MKVEERQVHRGGWSWWRYTQSWFNRQASRLGWATLGLALAWAVDVQVNAPGPRLNTSGSIPVGLYWFSPGRSYHKGDVVVACLPESLAAYALRNGILAPSHGCPTGVEPVAKFVAATAPDVVEVARDGMRINGALWPLSRPYAINAHGQLILHASRTSPRPRYFGPITLAYGQVVLMSDHPYGWDGRYIGAINDTAIIGTWRPLPLLTWKG